MKNIYHVGRAIEQCRQLCHYVRKIGLWTIAGCHLEDYVEMQKAVYAR